MSAAVHASVKNPGFSSGESGPGRRARRSDGEKRRCGKKKVLRAKGNMDRRQCRNEQQERNHEGPEQRGSRWNQCRRQNGSETNDSYGSAEKKHA